MVLTETELYALRSDAGVEILTGAQLNALPDSGRKNALLLKKSGQILALTASEAQDLGVARTLGQEDLLKEISVTPEAMPAIIAQWEAARKAARAFSAEQADLARQYEGNLDQLNKLQPELQKSFLQLRNDFTRENLKNVRDKIRASLSLTESLLAVCAKQALPAERIKPLQGLRDTLKEQSAAMGKAQSILPKVKKSERGGKENFFGYRPIYTFEAESHRDSRSVRRRKYGSASDGAVAEANAQGRRATVTRIKPGGLPAYPDEQYIARFRVRVIGGGAGGKCVFKVSCGKGSGETTLPLSEIQREHGANFF